MTRKRIPLFPLEVVLFPGALLPLHIFEPRYKLMIRQCIEKPEHFGIVLSKAGGIAKVGCTAEVMEILKAYPDGRMDIVAIGKEPFQIFEVLSEKPYHEAEIEYLPRESSNPQEDPAELIAAYEECHVLLYSEEPDVSARNSAQSLAYYMAGSLPLDLKHKQELLELRDESARRKQLLGYLTELIPVLGQKQRLRAKARGNGHGF